MRPTLFYIPQELLGLRVLGWGWLLMIWIGISGAMIWRALKRSDRRAEVTGLLPMSLLVAAAIVFLLPRIEEPIPAGFATFPPNALAQEGLPIRGYGVMLMLGVVLGVALAAHRAARAGLDPDLIYGLAFAMVLGGIIGARLFFVAQYWEEIRADSAARTLANLFSLTKGGLVVYGSLVGAAVAFAWYCRRRQLPLLPLADLIAPSLALGLALGRLGCLLNGCCFGGICPPDTLAALTFPPGSPPYDHQLANGQLHGIRLGKKDNRVIVTEVDSADRPELRQLRPGSRVVSINGYAVSTLRQARAVLEVAQSQIELGLADGQLVRWSVGQLPPRSRPVYPTQLYSSVNATLLFLVSLCYFPYRRRHGEVVAGLLSCYAVTRFLLELIRSDEDAFLGRMTISQDVSLLVGVAMIVLWTYVLTRSGRVAAADVP